MDFTFRCNITKCRVELQHQAVVTTCSHIFCVPCASNSGLANPVGGARICPACKAHLVNKDDAVITQLDPSEDYKTSVLSGFTPTLIIECASRALGFYNYQAVHEATYQEYLSRRLAEKVAGLNGQLDDTINNANGQIQRLQDALRDSQARIEQLQNQHVQMQDAFKQKAQAHQRLQHQYNAIKGEKMLAQTLNEASDEVENLAQNVYFGDRDGSTDHIDVRRMHSMRNRPGNQARCTVNRGLSGQKDQANNSLFDTPRTQRQSLNFGGAPRASQVMTADGGAGSYRQPLGDLNVNGYTRQANSGYGMSAGIKAGKRSVRPVVSTPRLTRYADAVHIPMR